MPWLDLRYPYPPLEPLSDDEVEAIHESSMVVLEEHGIAVLSEKVQRRFQQIGARVDKSNGVIRVDRETVLDLISKAPTSFFLTPRNAERRLEVGGDQMHFGMVSGPPSVHDCLNGRRPGNFEDYRRLVKLGQIIN